ncbi:MAG: sporulation protein YabP, partial [Clostridia bacterium]|nr:sporulation protein YabP [Clostridia bacterium]
TIILDSSYGKLAVKGSRLHILNFNTETGDLTAEGRINALIYTAEEKSGGFFSKLLR